MLVYWVRKCILITAAAAKYSCRLLCPISLTKVTADWLLMQTSFMQLLPHLLFHFYVKKNIFTYIWLKSGVYFMPKILDLTKYTHMHSDILYLFFWWCNKRSNSVLWEVWPYFTRYIDSIFIPLHTLVAGYYVFTLAVHVSAHPFVCSPYIRLSALRTLFPFDNLSIYKRISFTFCICICTNNVSLGIVDE